MTKGLIEKVKQTIRSVRGSLNDNGEEILDPVPLAADLPLRAPPSLEERLQRYIRHTVNRSAESAGYESFDESDDFDCGDDDADLFESDHELSIDQERHPSKYTAKRSKTASPSFSKEKDTPSKASKKVKPEPITDDEE